jgi:hypothetical protein
MLDSRHDMSARIPSSAKTLHVVSVSIGSSKRHTHIETEILGRRLLLERRGTDGDLQKAATLIRELDSKVDAIGLGGLDMYLMAGGRRYELRDGVRLARNAQVTPVVCGAGLKATLERVVVEELDAVLAWRDRRVLMVAAVDRFGMAEALAEHGADMIMGDLIFGLGLPVPLRSLNALVRVTRLMGPIVTKLPIGWIYPTGEKQEETVQGRGQAHFDWADVIAGDFLFIKRYMPQRLDGKTILTNTTTKDDVALLRARGVKRLITTTPRYDGRSLATNLLEAAFVAVTGQYPLAPEDYRRLIRDSGLKPDVQELNP